MTASSEQAEFVELYTAEWEWRAGELGHQPEWLDTEPPSLLPDVSADAQQRRSRRWRDVREAVAALDPEQLDPQAQSDRAVYLYQLDTLINQVEHRQYEAPVNSDTAFWQDLLSLARRPFGTEEQLHGYLSVLRQVPEHFSAQITNLRAGLARGFAPPRVSMVGRDATARTVALATNPEETDLYRPVRDYLGAAGGGAPASLGKEVAEAIELDVIPAFQELSAFLAEEYLPGLPEQISATERVGSDYYQNQLAEFSTLDLTPSEIHRQGLDAVAALREQMSEVAGTAGFHGDVDRMLEHMRTSPEFYVERPEDLLKEAAWHAKKFDGVVHRYFGRVPRQRFGIVEPPADLAPFYTFGRGGVDRYVLNTYSLPDRPLYSLPALTLHEAAPGHAFQIPFSLEMEHLPPFRRYAYSSAFGEGWALYGEHLGVEMGMYETPFEMMGMLSFQMWRAVRLVMDPGIHALGWSREQAIEFLSQNTAIGQHEVVTEIDRYISWPGQAVAYYLGKTQILKARERAEAALGERFTLPAFHDLLMSLGTPPLKVMDTEVDRFIRGGGVSPFSEVTL